MKITDLKGKEGVKFRIPKCTNEFVLFRGFGLNTECFSRVHDGMLHYGREFVEYKNGRIFLCFKLKGNGYAF